MTKQVTLGELDKDYFYKLAVYDGMIDGAPEDETIKSLDATFYKGWSVLVDGIIKGAIGILKHNGEYILEAFRDMDNGNMGMVASITAANQAIDNIKQEAKDIYTFARSKDKKIHRLIRHLGFIEIGFVKSKYGNIRAFRRTLCQQ